MCDKKLENERKNGNSNNKSEKKFFCRCKNSRCIKKYCECFINGESCDSLNCCCSSCKNFKFQIPEKINSGPNFCNCTRSNCLKNYCECFKFGRKCSIHCRCLICLNQAKLSKSLVFEKIRIMITENKITIDDSKEEIN